MSEYVSQHPLQIQVIMAIVFEYVPKEMWRACRLVCKPWHDLLLFRWRKDMDVVICGFLANKLRAHKRENFFMELPSFMATYKADDFRRLGKYPIRSVTTEGGIVTIGALGGPKATFAEEMFWKFCGEGLHQLHLHGVTIASMDMLHQILFELTPNLKELTITGCFLSPSLAQKGSYRDTFGAPKIIVQPNLKILNITLREDGESWHAMPLKFHELLSHFAHIEELRLQNFFFDDARFFDNLLIAIRSIRKKNKNSVLKIKKLDLKQSGLKFNSTKLRRLNSLKLPLEEVHVEIVDTVNPKLLSLLKLGKVICLDNAFVTA